MKIYHTETQEDYDALMVELEEEGCKWLSERKPTEAKYHWFCYEEKTCVRVSFGILTKFDFRHYKEEYPGVPITKYKAKADEKMRFTKENIYKLFIQYRKAGNYTLNDLQDEILNLDDTPEQIVVPKFVADVFSSELHFEYEIQESRDIPHVLSTAFSEVSRNKNVKFIQWVKQYPDKYVMAVKYGCEVEKEPLYYIPLPHLETPDGLQQVLSKHKNDTHYFASRPNEKLKQRYTKEELEQVPEVYKPYAKPIEEESE